MCAAAADADVDLQIEKKNVHEIAIFEKLKDAQKIIMQNMI